MNTQISSIIDSEFKQDVFDGLTAEPKYLYSKYIYDEIGDKLFQQIMALPEYYLTNAELEIFESKKETIAAHFQGNQNGFDLIELGAGDGKKTKILLQYFADIGLNFTYKPIDISQNAIDNLSASLAKELPNVHVEPEQGEYFEVLERIKTFNSRKKVILFLGSNIGNLLHPRAIEFLSKLRNTMSSEDLLFIGMDQKKKPQLILDAYNDSSGVTEAFNKNLLHRINKDLDGNFNLDAFQHWETYDPETGTAKSYLVSSEKQNVEIRAIDLKVEFEAWETIHTEISQKYDDKVVNWLASESGLTIEISFTDKDKLYKNYLMKGE